MDNSEITTAESLLKLARRVRLSGSFNLEDILKAHFSEQSILHWLKDISEHNALSGVAASLKEFIQIFSDLLPIDVSNGLFIEREMLVERMRKIKESIDSFEATRSSLLKKAKEIEVKQSASDLSAINPEIIVSLLEDKTTAFLSDEGKISFA